MTTRKADFDAENEPGSKRARLNDNHDHNNIAAPSLDVVNDDCLLLILSYLPVDYLNSIAICSRRCYKSRTHESLDQRRKGTIVVSEGSTFESIVLAIARNGWNRVFQGNRTHLEIVGLERLQGDLADISYWQERYQLTGVTRLDLKCSPNGGDHRTHYRNASFFSYILPNVREADMGDLELSNQPYGRSFPRPWDSLTKLTWNRYGQNLSLDGGDFFNCTHFTEFYSDNSCFLVVNGRGFSSSDEQTFMFSLCRHLERLSIKSATIKKVDGHDEAQPVSQDMLIKMVRRHPTLRWLRSDLTEENIATLKVERPDITFVSD